MDKPDMRAFGVGAGIVRDKFTEAGVSWYVPPTDEQVENPPFDIEGMRSQILDLPETQRREIADLMTWLLAWDARKMRGIAQRNVTLVEQARKNGAMADAYREQVNDMAEMLKSDDYDSTTDLVAKICDLFDITLEKEYTVILDVEFEGTISTEITVTAASYDDAADKISDGEYDGDIDDTLDYISSQTDRFDRMDVNVQSIDEA